MKHFFAACFLVFGIAFTSTVNAQYCGNSGSGICTPDNTITTVGFSPPDTLLPCIVDGVNYSQVIQFHTPATVTQGGSTYTLNYIIIDTISNMPCGSLCWASASSNNRINGNATGCIKVSGVSYDQPGEYQMHVIVDANVQTFIGAVTVGNQDAAALGLKYYARVEGPGGACAPVDTNSTGLQAGHVGTIGTPSISGAASFCSGGSSTLTVSGGTYYSYAWSTGAKTASLQVTNAGTYTVTVFGACTSATASKTITLNQAPNAAINPSTTSVCSGGSATLTASGGTSYAWSNSSSSAQITVSPSSTTTYVVTVTGSNTCTATAAQQIALNPAPPAAVSPNTVSLCAGSSAVLTASGGTSYAWSNAITTAKDTVAPLATTTYVVTVTDANTCTATASRTVTVGSVSAHVTPNGPTTFCLGGSVTLSVDSSFASYIWSNNATTQSIVVNAGGTYTVTVTQGNCSGVSNPVTINITSSNLSPTIVGAPDLNICPGATATLDAGPGYGTYQWSTGATSQTISVTNANSYSVTVSQGTCHGSATATVNVANYPIPVNINASGPLSVCAGTNLSLDAGSGYASYAWSNGSNNAIINPTSTGDYAVTVTKNFCTGSDTVHVDVLPNPQPVISPVGPITACTGDIITLDAGSFTSYAWNNSSSTQTIQPGLSGHYAVTVTQNGCTGTDAVDVTFNTRPVPVITVIGSAVLCTGQSVTLDAGAGYTAYAWTGGATTQSNTVNTAGLYNVTVTENGCTGSATAAVNVTVNTIPTAQLTSDQTNSSQIILFGSPAGATYQWLFQPGNSSTLQSISVTSQNDTISCAPQYFGNYYVVATVNGCADTSNSVAFICSGVSDIKALVDFNVYPNPANDVLNIWYALNDNAQVKIAVVDLTGRRVVALPDENQQSGEHYHAISVANMPAGIYMVNFTTEKGSFNTRFVKQ